ncbi:MAG: hypothetical protein ACKVU1_06130 [bacterium]
MQCRPFVTWKQGAETTVLACALMGCSTDVTPPTPPGGGQRLELSAEQFASDVEPVLIAKGCDVGGDCHGGGIRGTFALSPASAKDVEFDFEQARLQVRPTERTESPLLTKPLAEPLGGAPHSYEPFASTDDPDYQAILGWINAGVLQ